MLTKCHNLACRYLLDRRGIKALLGRSTYDRFSDKFHANELQAKQQREERGRAVNAAINLARGGQRVRESSGPGRSVSATADAACSWRIEGTSSGPARAMGHPGPAASGLAEGRIARGNPPSGHIRRQQERRLSKHDDRQVMDGLRLGESTSSIASAADAAVQAPASRSHVAAASWRRAAGLA